MFGLERDIGHLVLAMGLSVLVLGIAGWLLETGERFIIAVIATAVGVIGFIILAMINPFRRKPLPWR